MIHRDITFENMSHLLVETIPELRQAYELQLKGWQIKIQPGPHTIYGTVLLPLIVSLGKTMEDDELLARVFRLLEEIATSSDSFAKDVLGATVLEYLSGWHADLLPRLRPFMGPETLKILHEIETWVPRNDGTS